MQKISKKIYTITNTERFFTYVDFMRITEKVVTSFLVLPPMIPLKPSKMVEWAESVYPPMNTLCISSKLEWVAV